MAVPSVQQRTEGDTLLHNNSPYSGNLQQNGEALSPTHPTGAHTGQGRGPKHIGERAAVGWEQNPELLQWRANVLLDEMMLGAVDIAANEAPLPRSTPARPVPTPDETQTAVADRRVAPAAEASASSTGYANGRLYEPEPSISSDSQVLLPPSDPQDEWSRPAWHFAEPATLPPPASHVAPAVTPAERTATLQEHTRYHHTPPSVPATERSQSAKPNVTPPDIRTTAVGAPPARPAPVPATKETTTPSHAEQWVFAAEQRYQQIAARHHATGPDSGASSGSRPGAPPTPTPGWGEPAAAFFDDFTGSEFGYANGQGTTRPTGGGAGGGRSRVNQNIRRSNLLPRMSTLDPHALQQEMVMLQTEIEQALPAGHESRVRALHLLQKAYAILQADASRSAEVDYYLQQVRTIGQRVQETLHWSNLYHSRLRLYLVAWCVLSVVVIGARYFYHNALAAVIDQLNGITAGTESLLAHNLLTILATFCAGALGGAAGAFITMRQIAHSRQGFFDRKYSLRGLILPLIGGVVGALFCLIFGVIYYLLGADPATNFVLGALPALLAFGFGVAQEFIYGTRS